MQIDSHRQVIGGSIYDTATAELIGWVYDNHIVDSDYKGIKRHLMRNADGRIFLFSLFGTMGNRPIGQIVPMNEIDAIRWCESNGVHADKILSLVTHTEAEFGGIAMSMA